MDNKGKRAAGKFSFSRRGGSLSFKDPYQEDRSIQYCSRLGCTARLNSMKDTQASSQEKMKYQKAPFRSTSSKVTAGSSSKSFSSSSDFRNSPEEQQNQTFLREKCLAGSSSRKVELGDIRYNRQELEDSDSSSRQGETDDSEYGSVMSSIQTVQDDYKEFESAIIQATPTDATEVSGSCTTTSSSRPQKQLNRRLGSGKQEISGSSARCSLVSRNNTYATKPLAQGMIARIGAGVPRYGLKNLGCTSISDILPSGCSSSEPSQTRRVSSVRKRHSVGETSSAGMRGMSRSSDGGYSGSLSTGLSGLLSERPLYQPTSRRDRNQSANRDSAVSVRTRWAPSAEIRTRLPEQEVDNTVTPSEAIVTPQMPQAQFSIPESVPENSSRSILADLPPVFHNTFGRSATTAWSARTRLSSRLEDSSSSQIFRGPVGDRDRFRRFHTEGIAEVLLALERIEQDDELSYEQLLVLKTNLFLGGLSLHDQHRDMRMDIDNMSYEELLALEEKMGTVSTALSDEALTKCLKRSIYTPAAVLPEISCNGDDDIQCSICQEEYAVGDEVGKLACEHSYHVVCVHQWLRQKNWCPVCKVSVCPS